MSLYGVDSPIASHLVGLEERSSAEAGPLPESEAHTETENRPVGSWWSPYRPAIQKDDDWELLWAPETNEFRFLNTRTGVEETVAVEESPDALAADKDGLNPEACNLSSRKQACAALEVALESGREKTVAQLLKFNIEPSLPIFYDTMGRSSSIEWTVCHGNLNLLEMFLSNMEVKSSDRVAATRALGLAVRLQDTQATKLLLSYGTHCDFVRGRSPSSFRS